MQGVNSPSSADTDTKAIVQKALRVTEQQALNDAAEKKMKVSAVKDLQREKFEKLIRAKGSDGAGVMGENLQLPEGMQEAVDDGIEKQHEGRIEAVAPVPDAYVLPEGKTVGVQNDQTREVGIAPSGLQNDRVPTHEAEHRKQQVGDERVAMPPIADPAIKSIRILARRAFREKAAVDAEGGLQDHAPEYFEYVGSSQRIGKYLTQHGHDGEKMIQEAADTKAGFVELYKALVASSIKERIENELVTDNHVTLAA